MKTPAKQHEITGLIPQVLAVILVSAAVSFAAREWKSGVDWPEPEVISPGDGDSPPSDAIVLFGGGNLDAWKGVDGWTFEEDYAIVGSNITTKQKFGDCQLHLEFATPEEVKGQGQGRGNSGIYFMNRYEVQILDSYENSTYYDGQCGSIYKQHPPLVNCSRKPGEWQSYDIIFTAPRFRADGSLVSPAYISVLQNGVLVQNHYQLQGPTEYIRPPQYRAHGLRDSIKIQYHGNPVRFRNIWIRDLMPGKGTVASPKKETPSAASATEAAPDDETGKDES